MNEPNDNPPLLPKNTREKTNRTSRRAIFWILGIALLLAVGFCLLIISVCGGFRIGG